MFAQMLSILEFIYVEYTLRLSHRNVWQRTESLPYHFIGQPHQRYQTVTVWFGAVYI